MGKSGRSARALLAAALLALALAQPSPARADEYDSQTAGHPVRVLAYLLHPVGVAFDYLLLRPAHWLGHQEPFRTLFGHEEAH